MIEIQIRRECGKPEPACGPNDRLSCGDCGAWTYGKPDSISHNLVVEWRPFAEVLAVCPMDEVRKFTPKERL